MYVEVSVSEIGPDIGHSHSVSVSFVRLRLDSGRLLIGGGGGR